MKTPINRPRLLWSAANRASWVVFLILAGCGGQSSVPAGAPASETPAGARVSGDSASEPAGGKRGASDSAAAVPAGVILPDPEEERGKADGPSLPK